MSTPRAMGSAKKRGHQHHPRNEGTRKKALTLESSSNLNLSKFSKNNAVSEKVTVQNSKTKNAGVNTCAFPECNIKEAKPQLQINCDTEVIDLTRCDDILSIKTRKADTKECQSDTKRRYVSYFSTEAEGSSLSDQENEFKEENIDPEIEELSKLRCTSETTEVVAEREKRRNRRCADYPGLAFCKFHLQFRYSDEVFCNP
ncbi:hypothetical protein NQ317_014577 [Molorchus minor]|uniref:Uncharacterized protein n=1 Tax=Molorchus minor TaxID=1323400 RepID=A0ABQ9JTV9_9CUCU|nr:hypothetical protein NQ317_014577 [Molorchus minor]